MMCVPGGGGRRFECGVDAFGGWTLALFPPATDDAHRQCAEVDVNQLLWVEAAVPVAAGTHRPGQHHACSVCSLPDVLEVHSPGNLLQRRTAAAAAA